MKTEKFTITVKHSTTGSKVTFTNHFTKKIVTNPEEIQENLEYIIQRMTEN